MVLFAGYSPGPDFGVQATCGEEVWFCNPNSPGSRLIFKTPSHQSLPLRALWGRESDDLLRKPWHRRDCTRRQGVKFHKTLGLGGRYKDGRHMPVDDPKLDTVWENCARYKRPVEIHTG